MPHNQPKPTTSVLQVPTYVSVYNGSTREPVVGALVVVTLPNDGVVAMAETDQHGHAKLLLTAVPGHELALPDLALAGIAILPGEALVVVVP